jgi:uncharacterized protein (TIRG00374 family)
MLTGIILLTILYSRVGLHDILNIFKKTDYIFLILSIICINSVATIQALRGFFLLTAKNNINFYTYLRIYYISLCFASISLGRLGLIAQIPLLYRNGIGSGEAIFNTIIDKFYDLSGFCIMAAICTLFIVVNIQNVIIIYFLSCIIILCTWNMDRIIILAVRQISRITNRFDSIYNNFTIATIPLNKKILSSFLTFCRLFLTVLMHWLAAKSLGLDFTVLSLITGTAFGALVSLLPVSVMGAGTRDILFQPIFAAPGITSSHIAAYSSLILVVYLSVAAVGGLFFLAGILLHNKKEGITSCGPG